MQKEPIRVLHLIEGLGSGGAERALYNALKHIDPTRIHSTVLALNDRLSFWVEPIRKLGIEVDSLRCRSHRDIPAAIVRLRRWLLDHPTDLVHTQLVPANIVGRLGAKWAGVRTMTSIQCADYETESWNTPALRVKRVIARSIDRWSAHLNCQWMIAVSEATRRSANATLHYPLDQIDVVYNGVDFADLERPVPAARPLRDQLGLPPDAVVLLNVGRVVSVKGLDYAISALPTILARQPNAHLVSVGATADLDWLRGLKTLAESERVEKHVHFLGERNDIPQLLRECDLFVFPSVVEGLSVALLEAMAAGCATVAAGIAPIAEVVTPGVDGWLVPPKDPAALAAAVLEALADGERRLAIGRAAAAKVRRDFPAAVIAARLTEVYERVA